MAVAYVKSGSGVTEFAQSTAYTSGSPGSRIVPKRTDTASNHLVAKRWVWECTTSGTSAAAEPTWPATVTQDVTTVTSGTAVFTARRPGFSSGTTANWSFATIYMDYPGSLMTAGDTVYVSNNHAESISTAFAGGTNTSALITGVQYVCSNDSAAPPTAVATTATVTTTGANNISAGLNNSYIYGVSFVCGSGDTGTRTLTAGGTCEECTFHVASTGASSLISASGLWRNCNVKFADAGQTLQPTMFRWSGGSLASGGTSPSSLITTGYNATVENVDLSNAGSAINLFSNASGIAGVSFRHVKMPTSWSGGLNALTPLGVARSELAAVGPSGLNYTYQRKTNGGEGFHETTIILSGGANNGTTGLSHKLISSAAALFPQVIVDTPEIVKWNDTVGSSITASVEILHDSAIALTDGEIWLETNYFSASGSPLGAKASSAKASVLATATNVPASSASWTTTGLTNPNKQKLSVTFTPQQAGFVHARVVLAKASKTVYIDPVLSFS